MSMTDALRFIQHVRSESALQDRLPHPGSVGLEALVALGAELGYTFSEEALRLAFKHDYAMRLLLYSAK